MKSTPPCARFKTSFGLRSCVPHVLAHEVVAGHRYDLGLLDVAEAVQDLGHPQRHGRLAGARVAGEAHVQRRAGRHETLFATQPVDHEQCGT